VLRKYNKLQKYKPYHKKQFKRVCAGAVFGGKHQKIGVEKTHFI
jgi:hypothetical protein